MKTRDQKNFDMAWFDEVYEYYSNRVIQKDSILSNYGYHRDILLMKYTRGDSFTDITEYFKQFIQFATEYKKNKKENGITDTFDFSTLENDVFPILAFALALSTPDKSRNIIDKELFLEGKDCLTDRIISATWNPERQIANYETWQKTAPAHKKYFDKLYLAIDAPTSKEQTKLIQDHLKNWHKKNWRHDVSLGSDPDYPKVRPRYYGQFAYEVAAVVMAFNIDDTEFKDDIYYPKELVEFYKDRTS